MRIAILLAAALVLVSGCATLETDDLQERYAQAARNQGLTPVYPPREEFQVGDIYLVSFDPDAPSDISKTVRIWLGTSDDMRQAANQYLTTRITFEDSAANNATVQPDFTTDVISPETGQRTSLPIVALPSVSARSIAAGSFGGFGILRSIGLAAGGAETVTLDFGDTRAFGLPAGSFEAQGQPLLIASTVCPNLGRTYQHLSNMVEQQTSAGHPCGEGRECRLQTISRTYLTRRLQYTYNSARIARLATAALSEELATNNENQPTLALPGNLDINIDVTTGEEAAAAASLIAELTAAVQSARIESTETSALSFVGLSSRGLVFSRTYQKPVTVAYESVDWPLEEIRTSCEVYGNAIAG